MKSRRPVQARPVQAKPFPLLKGFDPYLQLRICDAVLIMLESYAIAPDSSKLETAMKLCGIRNQTHVRSSIVQLLKPFEHRWRGPTHNRYDRDEYGEPHTLYRITQVRPIIQTTVLAFLRERVERFRRVVVARVANAESPLMKRLRSLATAFSLSPMEKEILVLRALYQWSPIFENCVDQIQQTRREQHFGLFFPGEQQQYLQAVSRNGRLARFGFLDDDGRLSTEILEYLRGVNSEPLSQRYFCRYTGSTLPLEKLMITRTDIETIRTLVKHRQPGQGLNILLGGLPGTGKTETARALAREMGLELYEIRGASPEIGAPRSGDNSLFRFRALMAFQNMQQTGNAAILIDEADTMLESTSSLFRSLFSFGGVSNNKELVNEALDKASGVQIWIANHLGGIDASTRRRFAYAIRYEKPTPVDRQLIWQTACENHGLTSVISADTQQRLAKVYDIGAGGIDSALRHAANLKKNRCEPAVIVRHVERLLKAQHRFTGAETPEPLAHLHRKEHVEISELNIEPAVNLKQVCAVLESISAQASPTRGRAGEQEFKDDDLQGRRMTVLLQGPPGTGKTHFAQHVADVLGRPLHVKTASSILSMWVGQSEKIIREAFREAQREGAVLFFDEIDGLLSSRERASHSWEVTQVNELLSALESFRGVFLAATNHVHLLDHAAMRRFHFHLRFGPLSPAGNISFFRKLLLPLSRETSPSRLASLRQLSGLVPSDFASVRERCLLVGDRKHPFEDLLACLVESRNARSQKESARIGFTSSQA